MAAAAVHLGTSGWYYDHWSGVLYPPDLPKGRRLEVYARHFNAVEINATYYRLPRAAAVEGWYRKAPPGFVYAAKAHQRITHRRRLRGCADVLARFLRSIAGLGEKLACILFQLPPALHRDLPLLEDFLALLCSKESLDAFRAAQPGPPGPPSRGGARKGGGSLPPAAFEFRHPSWEEDSAFDLLRRFGAAHVVVSREGYPFAEVHTARFAYYRCHGPGALYASSYGDEWLYGLADRLARLAREGMTSFTFFNNDAAGHAVRNAWTLQRRLAELGLYRPTTGT